MNIKVVYIFPSEQCQPCPGHPDLQFSENAFWQHLRYACRFVASFRLCPPGENCTVIAVSNGGRPSSRMQLLMTALDAKVAWIVHDDTGWDVGAYQAVAKVTEADFILWLGGPSHFRRPGWLRRMREVWEKSGPGLYGAIASYERHPHIATNGFWCSPDLIRSYPKTIVTYDDRAEFESGPTRLTSLALSKRIPVKLVTWCGEYGVNDFRKPANIFRRGDQSNCLVMYRHTDIYESSNPGFKDFLEKRANILMP